MSEKIIDVHVHLFNLKYLPVSGILRSRGVPSVIAKGIAFILIKLTNSSNFNKKNKPHFLLDDSNVSFLEQTNSIADDGVVSNIQGGEDSKHINLNITFSEQINSITVDDIVSDIAYRVDPTLFNNAKVQLALIEFERSLNAQPLQANISFLDSYDLVRNNKQAENSFIYKKIKSLLEGYDSVKKYLRWFRFMMRSEEAIYKNLLNDYNQVDTYVFHMIDSFYFFKGSPRFSMKAKINKMQHFINKTDKKVIGFVAHNPRRKKHMSLIKMAIEQKGFTGIKFYPPLGYRPIENDKSKVGIPDVKYGKKVEKRVTEMFRYAVSNDIPVFTHCTPSGFEAISGKTGKNSDPKFWKTLLEKKEFSNLRLCLGHAGGTEGWFSKTKEGFENSYAKTVYDLCVNYKNVYCEVGFLEDVHNPKLVPYFIERLKNMFKNDNGLYKFSCKIKYGSDYHILFNHGIENGYDLEYRTIFKEDGLKEYAEKFFYKNAEKYLKINS